jgi:uncharacterized repeat protein (TIGR03806 family)
MKTPRVASPAWRRGIGIALLGLAMLGAAPAPPPVDGAALLADAPAPQISAYHLFTDTPGMSPNARVTPFRLITPLFTDYALKRRYLYLPPGTQARYVGPGVFDFPVGAALIKTFLYPADFRRPKENLRLIETRLLIHKPEGWVGLTYVWNADGSDARLVRAGKRMDVSYLDEHGAAQTIDYAVPNQNQCKSCHSQSGALSPLGPKARNLNSDYDYAGGAAENQLAHWTRIGALTGAPDPKTLAPTPRWDNPSEPLALRARAYLDVNCGHCHNPAGLASNSGLYLNWEQPLDAQFGLMKRPVAAGRGAGDLLFDITSGDPDHAILTYRMASNEPAVMMPQLGRSVVHREGLELIRAYVRSLKPAPSG